jgi:hypothetical protein
MYLTQGLRRAAQLSDHVDAGAAKSAQHPVLQRPAGDPFTSAPANNGAAGPGGQSLPGERCLALVSILSRIRLGRIALIQAVRPS